MNNRLKALVIDTDPDQAKAMADLVKDLFSSVRPQSDLGTAERDFLNARPHVLFVNLTIPQRSNNFEWLEKIDNSGEELTIIFGYNDSHDTELLAHAIENGVHDIFTRPYDVDIISTKITRYYQSDKTLNRQLSYSNITPSFRAQVKFEFKLTSVDENGFTFRASHFISKGTTFPVKTPIIKDIFEADVMEFMVTRTWASDDLNDFYVFAEPKDIKETAHAALRRFILRKL